MSEITKFRDYKFSQKEIARHRCLDCGINVIEADDYCMINDEIWENRFGALKGLLRPAPHGAIGTATLVRARSPARANLRQAAA
jgi:hypothetical protein